jgi:hypothetical protein
MRSVAMASLTFQEIRHDGGTDQFVRMTFGSGVFAVG